MKYLLSLILLLGLTTQAQTTREGRQSHAIKEVISKYHYEPKPFDDEFSKYIFKDFISTLDPNGYYFLQTDVEALSKYETEIDDQVENKTSEFFQAAVAIYETRLRQADSLILDITKSEMDFTKEEYYSYKEEDYEEYVADLSALKERWRKWLKNATLEEIFNGNYFENPTDTTAEALLELTDEALTVMVDAERYDISSLLEHPSGLSTYLSTFYLDDIAHYFDPHTTFFSDTERDSFEEDLSGSREAYGFSLEEDERGRILIAGVMPGSSAWISNAINKGDVILEIRLNNGKPVDVTKMTLTQLQVLLDEEDDHTIDLKLEKEGGIVEEVELVKAEIYVDEDVIKSVILKGDKNVGYITLPDFYTDWSDLKNGLGCANDVAKNIVKLKKEGIDGLIIDLRNNGGGSVKEAIDLAGIFINYGPISITQDNYKTPESIKDMNRGAIYMGPLAIMVNNASASASEFFAAAMQDYNRALIVGSQTYGKATGQIILPLDPKFDMYTQNYHEIDPTFGYLKFTRAKYYRITNKSHQKQGVTPHVKIRDYYELYDVGEKYYEMALVADEVEKKMYYTPFKEFPVSKLQSNSDFRMSSNIPYQELCAAMDTIKNFTDYDQMIPLYMDGYLKNERKMDALMKRLFSTEEAPQANFDVTNHQYDLEILKMNDFRAKMNESYLENVKNDMYIGETFNILVDYINSK